MADSLTVHLGLDAAEYASGLKKATDQTAAATNAIAGIFDGMGRHLEEILSISYFEELIKSSLEAASHLDDLSQKTGLTADALGGLGIVAKASGLSLDTVASGVDKLNKTVALAASGNKAASAAFAAMGISIKGIASSANPAQAALTAIADKFATYANGPEKTRLAMTLLSKAGAELIPVFNQGGQALKDNAEFFDKYSAQTEKSRANAVAFSLALSRAQTVASGFGNAIAGALAPILTSLANSFIDASKDTDRFSGTISVAKILLEGMAVVGVSLTQVFLTMGEAIGAAVAILEVVSKKAGGAKNALGDLLANPAQFTFKLGQSLAGGGGEKSGAGQIKAIIDAFGEQRQKEFDKGTTALANAFEAANKKEADAAKPKLPNAPKIGDTGKAAGQAAIYKSQLDGELALIKTAESDQLAAIAYGNNAVENEYQLHNISLADKFKTEADLRDAQLGTTVASLDKQIAAERAYIAKIDKLGLGKTSSEGLNGQSDTGASADARAASAQRESAVQKIKDLEAQRSSALLKNTEENVLNLQKEMIATRALAAQYDSLTTEIKGLAGDTVGQALAANAAKFKAATDAFGKQSGSGPTLDYYAHLLEVTRQLTQAQVDFQHATSDEAGAEALLAAKQTATGTQTLVGLAQLRDLRVEYIAVLEKQTAAADKLAAANPENTQATRDALALKVALEQAKNAADPLAKTLNDLFENDLQNALAGFLDGTKSAKQAFTEFANSVIADIAKIAAKNLAESILGIGTGTSGSNGGVGGFLSSVIGYFTGGGGTTAPGAVGGINAGMPAYGLATGTNYVPYDGFQATLHKGEAVVPKEFNPAAGGSGMGGGNTQHINVSVQGAPGQSHDSLMQQGTTVGRGIQRALSRGFA